MERDVTAQSFTAWRAGCGLSAKTVNDLLGAMKNLLNWMEGQGLILSNPLSHVQKVENRSQESFRRALFPADEQIVQFAGGTRADPLESPFARPKGRKSFARVVS